MEVPASEGPLTGLTVVGLEQAVSAPLCTRTLADLGARVIKIENPAGGDFARDYDDVVHGMATHFVWLNRNKESVTLNLKSSGGLEVMHRLLSIADAFVTNLAPGATTRLGLDAETLERRYPQLVNCEISGYGSGGPLSAKRAYDLLAQAESGACSITGLPGAPAKPGPPIADACAGLYGVISILATLHSRGRTGHGAKIGISLFDTMTELMGYALTWSRYTGEDQEPVGMGSPSVAPYSSYRTSDGQVVVLGTTNDREWQRLANELLDRADLATAEQYRSGPRRVEHRAELDRAIGDWCARHTLTHIQKAADDVGIGNARYNTTTDVVGHPHLAARDRWQEVDSPVGPVSTLLPPPDISGHLPILGPIPALGEHTDTVLRDLGLDEEAIRSLRAEGAIGTAYIGRIS
ncbi:CoA transferase [Nocardia sp. CA2R105]|uniref:CaiB/BaiF CoA transferase family protein n=1 Tax=Nocardia coffeae TaxID=2873381 RepID=UPI001CA6B6C0|nr:CaiB/BaiF CoA-transferase family protein [Nocardia coffeae]MBY8863578.1 CoA transferase [Nocardia coffeae]